MYLPLSPIVSLPYSIAWEGKNLYWGRHGQTKALHLSAATIRMGLIEPRLATAAHQRQQQRRGHHIAASYFQISTDHLFSVGVSKKKGYQKSLSCLCNINGYWEIISFLDNKNLEFHSSCKKKKQSQ